MTNSTPEPDASGRADSASPFLSQSDGIHVSAGNALHELQRRYARRKTDADAPTITPREECFLDAIEWKECIADISASWELDCLIETRNLSGSGFPAHSMRIRIEHDGDEQSFDPDRWAGMIETIEQDFEHAKFQIDHALSKREPNPSKSWQAWVIRPSGFYPLLWRSTVQPRRRLRL